MEILTETNASKLLQVDSYDKKLISLLSILEGYLSKVSDDNLKNIGRSNLQDVTLSELALLYNASLSKNSGLNGVCWEYAVFNSIFYNDTTIQDLLNTAINYLSNSKSFERLNGKRFNI